MVTTLESKSGGERFAVHTGMNYTLELQWKPLRMSYDIMTSRHLLDVN